MKINYSILLIFFGSFMWAQSKQALDKVMLSKDVQEIAAFIKNYPSEPNVPFLKRKLNNLTTTAKTAAKTSATAVIKDASAAPRLVPAGTASAALNPSKKDNGKPYVSAKRVEDALNHLFNNDPTNPDAYLQINNQSECDIRVKIEGKKAFYLEVPKKTENFVLVPKGNYRISTDLCQAPYNMVKNLTQDTQIKFNATKKAGK